MMNNYDVVKMECSDVKFKNWAHTCIAKTSSLGTEQFGWAMAMCLVTPSCLTTGQATVSTTQAMCISSHDTAIYVLYIFNM